MATPKTKSVAKPAPPPAQAKPAPTPMQTKAARGAKREAAMTLIRREQGATMAELTTATGWLPHSTRAVISGLRKKGDTVTRTQRDGMTCYKIDEQS